MQNKSKAWIAILAIFLFIVIVSVGLVVGGRAVSRHLPGNALLTLNISGPIPQRSADDPIAELFGPQPPSFIDLRDALVRAAGDKRVRGVRVKVSELQAGFATVQEVRSLLAAVGRAGKPTWAYLDTAGEFAPGNLEYLLASACKRVAVNPIGDVNLVGLAARSPFIRGTFDKLLIEPDFPGIGDYKTARFFYTEKSFTPAHREMFAWLVDSLQRQMVAGIADGRGLTAEQVTALIQRGPFLGPAAVDEHLIDELVDWPTFAASTTAGPTGKLTEVGLRQYLKAGRPDRKGVPIAVVVAEGGIQRGESGYSPVPLFGGDVMGSSTIARAFQQVRDSKAKAVIFRINSGGGSAVASEIIRAEMVKTAEKMPVVVSMGDVAGSGGYWITCGANSVIASPATITASIGVLTGHLAMSRFWEEKLGVTWGRLDGAPNAAIYDSLDAWTPEQRQAVDRFLVRIYDAFLDRVSAARKLSREEVDAVGRGRVFTGAQAVGKGLLDELGGFDAAVAKARELAGLKADAAVELQFYPKRRNLLETLLERERDDGQARLARALQQAATGQMLVGPVWLPPIEVR
jgi:protease-4